jgi:HD-GYP domain-containing protein (c-di-GMP phosphodiesterase class II)
MERRARGESRLAGVSIFAFAVSLAVILAAVLVGDRPFHALPVFLLALALVAAESMGEDMAEGGRSTYGVVVLFCAVAALSLPGAMAVALFSGLRVNPRPRVGEWPRVLYNGAASSLTVGACAWWYHLLGGNSTVFTLGGALRSLGPLLASAILFWALNTGFMALGLRLDRGSIPGAFLSQGALPLFPAQMVFSLVGWGLGIVFAQNSFHLAGPEVVSTAAEAFRGFFALSTALALLGVAWYFSGKNVGLLEGYDESIRLLVDYLEKREPYLDGHSSRVMNYALLLGRRLNLPLYELRKLGHAALLHDLGRAAVPREILTREGVLSEEEFERIKQHPLVGASWLEEVEYLSDIADAVRHHHEYYDGGGYVDHLEGETIPLGARILALADAFEAMLQERPYRGRKDREEAAAELRQNAGKQFDPRLVEVFLEVLRETGLLPAEAGEEVTPEGVGKVISAPTAGRRGVAGGALAGVGRSPSLEVGAEATEETLPREEPGIQGKALASRAKGPEMPAETAEMREEGAWGGVPGAQAPSPGKKPRWTWFLGPRRREREEMIRRRREARERWRQQVLRELSEEMPEERPATGEGEEGERGV